MQPRWFWGGFLIIGAGLLITNQLGLLAINVNLFTLFLTLVLAGFLIKGLRYLDFFSIIMSLTFLAVIYARPLGITALTPWTIIVAGLLLSFGLTLLFPRRWQHWTRGHSYHHHHHRQFHDDHADQATINDDIASINVSMTNSIRYLHSANLSAANINVSMGGVKIYFDDVQLQDNQATIKIDVSLGSAELYIPQNWQVKSDLDVSLATFDDGKPATDTVGPVIYLTGGVSLGSIAIIYI
ncbi:LiaF transmembrane domain-containing protein [Lactiplantibacillus songbeiensis]|uniref:LiaF transmembrane domain-containing protein n=1 Tax=Lactiplantibacillus songbeiensis TaxID=2559920 RepID=A0ABW4BWD0_9LACO|nr:hypothetical protein [Lactiplantibacillus songbeiensis]